MENEFGFDYKCSGIWIFRYGYLGVVLKIWCFVRKVS